MLKRAGIAAAILIIAYLMCPLHGAIAQDAQPPEPPAAETETPDAEEPSEPPAAEVEAPDSKEPSESPADAETPEAEEQAARRRRK